jgi:hypothetical protein
LLHALYVLINRAVDEMRSISVVAGAVVEPGADAQVPHRADSIPATPAFLAQLLRGWDGFDRDIDDARRHAAARTHWWPRPRKRPIRDFVP